MEQNPSWKARSSSASQEIPSILLNPKVHYPVQKHPRRVSVISQINPVHALKTEFFKIHFNIILPSTPRSYSLFPSLCSPPTCHIPRPPFFWLDHPR